MTLFFGFNLSHGYNFCRDGHSMTVKNNFIYYKLLINSLICITDKHVNNIDMTSMDRSMDLNWMVI